MANNRVRNPDEYGITYRNDNGFFHIVDTLGNRTRVRHTTIMNRFINTIIATNGLYELDTSGVRVGPAQTRWDWGNFGTRLGGSRSADGMIYSLPNAPPTLTGGNSVVAKFIFADDNGPAEEVKISNLLGKERIGPKIFKCYSANVAKSLFIRNIGTDKLRVRNGLYRGSSFINLFQQFVKYNFSRQNFNRVFIIIMENLYSNPVAGVEAGFTVSEIVSGKPGTSGMRVPLRQLVQKYTKMHELGVVHGDMHTGNIVVQKLARGRFSVRIIDFGRSIYQPGVHFNDVTSRLAINRQESINRLPRYRNNDMLAYATGALAAKDSGKLKSGIISLLNSVQAHHRADKEQALALVAQLEAKYPVELQGVVQRKAAAEAALNNARRRGSILHTKAARVQVLNPVVQTVQRRAASVVRRGERAREAQFATLNRRRAVRPPTVTGVKRAEINFQKRIEQLAKEHVQSLQRREASALARARQYNAYILEQLANAGRRKLASLERIRPQPMEH